MTGMDLVKVYIEAGKSKKTVPIRAVFSDQLSDALGALSKTQKQWVEAKGFTGKAGQVELVPGDDGKLAGVLFGLGPESQDVPFHLIGSLPDKIPAGAYAFDGDLASSFDAALFWGLGAYKFDRYKSDGLSEPRQLKLSKVIDKKALFNIVEAVWFGRDLINTPANDLGPDLYEARIKKFASAFKAKVSVVKGGALLTKNFPMVHAVGRAAEQEPRLIELNWGQAKHPSVTLVGKGICYDTGGLNLKPGNAMSLMKKDMGGSATALSVAHMVMGAKLPISLRVLLPIAENNISGNAFRAGDVLQSRKGITVEIENTDAEGRLVLADALAYGDEKPTDLMLCFATLTGAARVGLGPDLPPFYTDDEGLAGGLEQAAKKTGDMMWRLPFWDPYDQWLSSRIADVNHISNGPFAGSITAALFLRRFVESAKKFAHFDIYGWTPKPLPGRPFGGEPQVARAVFEHLKSVYG